MSEMGEMEKQHVLLGNNAEDVLNNPTITQALSDVRKEIREALFNSKPEEVDVRENAYFMDAALSLLQGKLIYYINRARGIEALHQAEEKQNG